MLLVLIGYGTKSSIPHLNDGKASPTARDSSEVARCYSHTGNVGHGLVGRIVHLGLITIQKRLLLSRRNVKSLEQNTYLFLLTSDISA